MKYRCAGLLRKVTWMTLILLGVMSLCSWQALADLSLSVAFGFNGHFLPDHLTPVVVTLTNTGPPLTGQLEISQTVRTPLSDGSFTQQLVSHVDLDSEAQKKFEFQVYIHGYIYPLEIRFRSGQDILQDQSVDLREAFVNDKISLGVGEPFPSKQFAADQSFVPVVYTALPTDWIGYDAVQRIYLGPLDTNLLTKPQQDALRGWVLWGGELVILGGENWLVQRSDWLEELLPMVPTHVEKRKIGDVETAVVLGQLKDTIRPPKILHQWHDLILASERQYGLGRVVFYNVDPWQTPGLSLSPMPERRDDWQLWSKLPKTTGKDLLAEVKLPEPSQGMIALVLGIVILGFGIFSSALTRHPGRFYVWAIVVLVLSATGGLWFYVNQPDFSSALQGLELSVERGFPDMSVALEQTWYSLYTRRGEQVLLEASTNHLREVLASARPDEHSDDLRIEQTDETLRARFYLLSQKQRHFVISRLKEVNLNLSVDRAVRPRQVTVYNGGPTDLTSSLVVVDGQWYTIGAVPAGVTQQFALTSEREISADEAIHSEAVRAGADLRELTEELFRRVREGLASGASWLVWGKTALFSPVPEEKRLSLKLYVISEGTYVAK